MVRVTGGQIMPLSAQGDMIVGGGGSAVGYTTRVPGPGISASSSGGVNTFDFDKAIDGLPATVYQPLSGQTNTSWGQVDLGVARRIGRYRIRQAPSGVRRMSGYSLSYSNSPTGPWTLVDQLVGEPFTDRTAELTTPAMARYWRLHDPTGNTDTVNIYDFELHEVATVGAGNPTRLAAPADGPRVLVYDLALGRASWPEPQAAEADLGQAISAAPTQAEVQAISDKVDALLAKVRAVGIIES